jgi:molecular chaperone DnaJ
MPAKNYYVALGVFRGETPAGIRAAYHKLAETMHPDLAGPAGAASFEEISEAYDVLSDPDRRRAHDREFREAPEPISLFGRPEQTYPSFDAFRERYLRNFTNRRVPKAEHVESLTVDAVLSPREAFSGCVIPVGVPVFGACPDCGGTGHVSPFPCPECAGSGLIEGQRLLRFHVPPGVRSGTVFEAPLELFGIGNLYLRVHVSISSAAA